MTRKILYDNKSQINNGKDSESKCNNNMLNDKNSTFHPIKHDIIND